MRIVHLGKYYPPEFGGIESVTQALAEDLAETGHEVTVLCFSRDRSESATLGGVSVLRVRERLRLSSQALSLSYFFRGLALSREAEVIHVHAPNLLAALVACLSPRRTRVLVHWHADIEGKGMLGVLARPLEQLLLRRASVVVATTDAYCRASAALSSYLGKVSVIPIGIEDVDHELRQCPGRVIPRQLLFVGRLVPYKGIPVLLRALQRLDDSYHLRIVGDGPDRSRLESLARDLQVNGQVDFLGKVSDQELKMLFATSTVFCLPSINRLEAFGVVLLEAMRAGCPSVSSRIPGSGVSWVNSSRFEFSPEDDEALASVLRQLVEDPHVREQEAQRARARYEAEFGRRRMSERFSKLYSALVAGR